jgi:NAD(P)-dependent dehydrogenase (short-subunit alcohol dehydrogenase family)
MNNPPQDWPYPFSEEDWQSCLNVLQHAALEPDQVPDLEAFKTLVTGIYKAARKHKRKAQLQARQEHDLQLLAATERVQAELPSSASAPAEAQLFQGKYCYSCKEKYHQVDSYYHRLCPDCADLNRQHRNHSLDLSGRIALVTGGRIKIGYATALRLLRSQAQVWVTTRFPAQAAQTFALEPDFDQWQSRLKIVGLDLLNLGDLESLIASLYQTLPHLDILINNAALTLWQPPAYYQALLATESHLQGEVAALGLLANMPHHPALLRATDQVPNWTTLQTLPSPVSADHNSWLLELDQIPAREMLEVQVINQIAPMMLCSQLKSLMLRSPFEWRWIVNVTAIEGQFSDPLKQSKHVHTNAAKAGLNMLTRTAASAYAQDKILMNAVDPGWVSSDQHAAKQAQTGKVPHKIPPLALEDASARICAPILDCLAGYPVWGKLLKNYQIIDW